MDAEKRANLESHGWKFGDATEFLQLNAAERELIEIRQHLAGETKRLRERQGLNQSDLGKRISTTQPRVALIEAAAKEVSLDQIAKAFFALGGRVSFVVPSDEGSVEALVGKAPGAVRTKSPKAGPGGRGKFIQVAIGPPVEKAKAVRKRKVKS
ncbi:hypothetical protein VT84_26730 [Gemmata sp. SH-PL17]|uniref:helix-turn-helix domain-containing protein n=1 Tax=Gemmata sp. SH-PL17 TaxID=1630693 RepID=UPI00078BD2B3|nr:XRE family transcriptional regulator [Gemmata sp. SH-PL17]AMV28029.1 hypothetical protein VT84_26730 [Gemmata sp. SH-PL17]